MKITKKRLEAAGFAYTDLGDEVPFEMWDRDGVEVWQFTRKHWIVDALDQGGVDVEFKTMEQLNRFWLACGLQSILPNARLDGQEEAQ